MKNKVLNMTVVYFQIAIILSLAFTGYFKKDYLQYVAIGWTIESFLLLTSGSSLSIIQLSVIWISYYYINEYLKKNKLIANLNSIIESFDDNLKKEILKYSAVQNLKSIEGEEHYKYLIKAINSASSEIIILSGWISDYVIDDILMKILKKKIKEGVNIFIGYGYSDRNNEHMNNEHTINALNNLRKIWQESKNEGFRGNIYVSFFPNHQKILIHEDNTIVIGSSNWLSNRKYKNHEYSIIIDSKDLVTKEKDRIKKLIKDNNKNYISEQF